MENMFDNWETPVEGEDFFKDLDQEEQELEGADLLNKLEKEEITEDPETKKSEKVEEKEEDLFATQSENVEVADTTLIKEEDKEESIIETSSSKASLEFLQKKGLVEFELEEGEELTDELAEEILEDSFEDTIETRIEEKLKDLPDDVKALIQYTLKGGSLSNFLKEAPAASKGFSEDLDITQEDNQIAFLRQILLEDGEDQETVDTQIDLLKDSGKLEKFATAKYAKWQKDFKEQKEIAVKAQADREKEYKEAVRKAKAQVNTYLTDNKDISGVQYSREDKKQLASFINDRSIKLNNGSTISEMQKELFYEIPKNDVAMMQLAVLLRNRNEDGTFNFKAIIGNKIKTEVTKEIKNNVRRQETNVPLSAGKNQSAKPERTLADYFSN